MSTTTEPAPEEVAFYRHTKKPGWGIGMICWERDGKRGYKFEDGELRIIAEDYYRLLEPSEDPASDSPLLRELAKMRSADGDDAAHRMTIEEQMAVFLLQFPGGFGSDEWKKGYRGKKDKRRLKRHREPALADAEEKLNKAAVDAMVDGGRHGELQEVLVDVLGATDMVSKAHLEPFRRKVATEPFSLALREALYGDDTLDARLGELFRQMSMLWSRVPWQVPTAILSVVHPKDFVCVKPSVFTKQADCSPLPIRPTKTPTPRVYRGYLELARQLRTSLSDRGVPPHDLWDIHDFIWITQRPAAAEFLAKVHAENLAANIAAPGAAPEPPAAEAASEAAPAAEPAPEAAEAAPAAAEPEPTK